MCGIAGIITPYTSQRNEESRASMEQSLHRMAQSLQHRGPDGQGIWLNPGNYCGLSHRRLSIIDLTAAGHQPMHYLDRYTIIHNGEIYNYIELREILRQKGYAFKSATDTEVIVAAYDLWKTECVMEFDGMFAFAIWDEKEKNLFAARDRFGEKPFFYHFEKERFVFGSEMKALWAAGVEKKPNLKMLFNFITIGYTDNPGQPGETFFDNIHKLAPATFLVFSATSHQLVIEKYWDLDPEEQNKKITEAEAIEQFNHLFTLSVKRRLRSDVAIGSSLSGGLDSSSVVAAISATQDTGSLSAFTASFPDYEKDELLHAKNIAQKFNLTHHIISVTGDELLNDWDTLCFHQEEPFGSASIYAQYKVFELAKNHNVKVLLDGQGADETLAGYHKYYKWYWQELFHKRKLLSSHELKAAKDLGVNERFGFKNVIASLFPDIATVFLERQYLLKAIRQEGLSKDFVRLQSKEAYYTSPSFFTLNGVLYFNTCTHGLEELLRFADRNSMANGRETRLPFLDHELVEFVFSLPARFKINKGWTKWLLRKVMEEKLPKEITWRKDKIGFEPPQKIWMEDSSVQEAIQEAKRTLVKENILDKTVLDKKIIPKPAHAADNFDWRYLSAAYSFR
jgi:asparagine synthase (glutamine-hydrolysing)